MAGSQTSWSLEEATALVTDDNGSLVAQTHPQFWTLIGPFGGWSAAVALRSVLEASTAGFVPVTISTHFAGAIEPGSVDVKPKQSRRNRGTEFWQCELSQNGTRAINAQIVLARRRDTHPMIESRMPDVPGPDQIETTQFPGVPWTTTYDSRFVTTPPGTDSGSFQSVNWVRLRHDEPMSFEALTALCDACVPRPFFRTSEFFPISTIALNVQLHVGDDELAELGHQFLLVEATGNQAVRGFFDQQLRLWSPAGQLLATSDQMFWYRNDRQ